MDVGHSAVLSSGLPTSFPNFVSNLSHIAFEGCMRVDMLSAKSCTLTLYILGFSVELTRKKMIICYRDNNTSKVLPKRVYSCKAKYTSKDAVVVRMNATFCLNHILSSYESIQAANPFP